MVVKSEIRHIKSLQQKKYRTQKRLFVVEGVKAVTELLGSPVRPYKIYGSDKNLLTGFQVPWEHAGDSELKKMSSLKTPAALLGVFHMPEATPLDFGGWILALDTVRDPGNLGTIIRLCDWFGLRHLLCSPGTADCYNPKVLQATMGSIARVNVVYSELSPILEQHSASVYGAYMGGQTVADIEFPESGILLLGNEANGISAELAEWITHRVGIPQYGADSAESLNVATAAAILLHEIRRPIRK